MLNSFKLKKKLSGLTSIYISPISHYNIRHKTCLVQNISSNLVYSVFRCLRNNYNKKYYTTVGPLNNPSSILRTSSTLNAKCDVNSSLEKKKIKFAIPKIFEIGCPIFKELLSILIDRKEFDVEAQLKIEYFLKNQALELIKLKKINPFENNLRSKISKLLIENQNNRIIIIRTR